MRSKPAGLALIAYFTTAVPVFAENVLPQAEPPFNGKININAKDSVPYWPPLPPVSRTAPNVLLILLDDVGFADTSTFGGLAQTPVLDRLASEGLRYNQFHTAAFCAPTRAALLSGRNQHRVGYGDFGGIGFPGYDGIWNKNAVSLAELLRRHGYSTAAFGKWHNTPYDEISPIGPFDRWPTGLGFEYFFGNMFANGSQWEPTLWRNTEPVAASSNRGKSHLTKVLVDDAIAWLHRHDAVASEKPYFMYFAPEAAHTPHHVPKEWIDKYRGQFDSGWDRLRYEIFARQKKLGVIPPTSELTPRPKEIPAWSSLSAGQKRLVAHQMEVYAAFVSHTDHEIGRLIETVKAGPHAQNTLILFIVGDNGAEANGGVYGMDDLSAYFFKQGQPVQEQLSRVDELGGPSYRNLYATAWAWMGSTPFQWTKLVASHFGGTRNPLVVSWPARIENPGGIRSQFSYVTDVAATVYAAAGIELPEIVDGVNQLPLDGVSLLETFSRADVPSPRRTQYFESKGNRAIYHDGWLAAARHFVPWTDLDEYGHSGASRGDFSRDRWELYDVERDFTQARDVAAKYPEKLRTLQALFDSEALRNNVYPLGAGVARRRPSWSEGRRKFVFYPDLRPMFGAGLPDLSQPHRLSVEVEIPDSGASGVMFSCGNRYGGVSLYAKENRIVYETNLYGTLRKTLTSQQPLPAGRAMFTVELSRDERESAGGRLGRLYIDGSLVSEAPLSPPACDVVDIGRNSISPVSNSYEAPFPFNGTVKRVTVELEESADVEIPE